MKSPQDYYEQMLSGIPDQQKAYLRTLSSIFQWWLLISSSLSLLDKNSLLNRLIEDVYSLAAPAFVVVLDVIGIVFDIVIETWRAALGGPLELIQLYLGFTISPVFIELGILAAFAARAYLHNRRRKAVAQIYTRIVKLQEDITSDSDEVTDVHENLVIEMKQQISELSQAKFLIWSHGELQALTDLIQEFDEAIAAGVKGNAASDRYVEQWNVEVAWLKALPVINRIRRRGQRLAAWASLYVIISAFVILIWLYDIYAYSKP